MITDVSFRWRANERKTEQDFRGLSRIHVHYWSIVALPNSSLPIFGTFWYWRHLASVTPPVINFHATAGRCVAFVRIYTRDITRAPSTTEGPAARMVGPIPWETEMINFSRQHVARYFGLYSVDVRQSWFWRSRQYLLKWVAEFFFCHFLRSLTANLFQCSTFAS